MTMTNKKCAHPACSCQVEEGMKYCSQYCKDAKATMEISCNCGHTGCAISEPETVMDIPQTTTG